MAKKGLDVTSLVLSARAAPSPIQPTNRVYVLRAPDRNENEGAVGSLYVASAELEEETGDESKIDPVALLNSTGKSGIHKFETACLLAPFLICIPGSIMHVRVNPPRVQCFVSSFKESCQRHFHAKGIASSRSAAVKSK